MYPLLIMNLLEQVSYDLGKTVLLVPKIYLVALLVP